MFMHSTEANLTHEQEQLLRETTINEDGPGSIVRDFENFLSFIAEQKLQLTKSYNLRLQITQLSIQTLQLFLSFLSFSL